MSTETDPHGEDKKSPSGKPPTPAKPAQGSRPWDPYFGSDGKAGTGFDGFDEKLFPDA